MRHTDRQPDAQPRTPAAQRQLATNHEPQATSHESRTTPTRRGTTISLLRQPGEREPDGNPDRSPDDDTILDDSGDGDRILCRQCGRLITNGSRRISVNGSHEHTFANPNGILFQIGCFSAAVGCAHMGRPTAEWSWFKGYRWRVTYCAGCGSHLGWLFTGGDHSFHGLVLANVISES